MSRWKLYAGFFFIMIIFLITGNQKNDILSIQDAGASMCLSCIGLE
ncbi:MAG: hypothetical protein HQL32_09080 [Planctomycetes bacterium]|nr:hypothetical protein [Planctomycetota bacterium]